MMLIVRVLANIVDLFVGLCSILITFVFILPFLSQYIGNSILLAVIGLLLIFFIIGAVQYPFLVNHQTIGKGFFSLKIVSVDQTRPLTVAIIVQREIFCKLVSCYFICLPVFFNKAGGHEEATRTAVMKEERKLKYIKK